MAKLRGYLVIIAPLREKSDAPLRPYEVPHERANAPEVLHKHLTRLLSNTYAGNGEPIHSYVDRCLADPAIVEHLRNSPPPGEVFDLARRLITIRKTDGQPGDAVRLLPSALRELAATVLSRPEGEDDDTALRRFSARVAYAVWNGNSLAVVSELAAKLLNALSKKDDSDPVKSALGGGMVGLIDPSMRGWDDEEGLDESERRSRQARLVDPELARAVLDVVWNVYHPLREPVMRWLLDVAGDPREKVRMRAGQVAGQLATYDFGYVYRELLRPLAESRRAVHRQAASWAVERVALDSRLTARACRQVRDWAWSPNSYLNDTAARAYTTHVGAVADDPLPNLYLIALRPEQLRSHSVALAVAHLYEPGNVESGLMILNHLKEWVSEDQRRLPGVHAARAVTYLAQRTALAPDDAWPALLCLARDDDAARKLLIGLWRAALAEPETTHRAWSVVHAWLTRAEERAEIDDEVLNFAGELVAEPLSLRQRALFHLQMWRQETPDIEIVSRLHTNITKGKP